MTSGKAASLLSSSESPERPYGLDRK